MRLLLRLTTACLGFLAVWILFVYQTTAPELIAGATASAITVVSGYVIFRIVPGCFQPRFRWVAQIYLLPAMIMTELWLLLKHLLREMLQKPSRSSFLVTRFEATLDGCHAAAQRALTVLFISTTPNSIVLDIDIRDGRLFYHQTEPAPVPKILRKLEG